MIHKEQKEQDEGALYEKTGNCLSGNRLYRGETPAALQQKNRGAIWILDRNRPVQRIPEESEGRQGKNAEIL
jgi:hypothetical protein